MTAQAFSRARPQPLSRRRWPPELPIGIYSMLTSTVRDFAVDVVPSNAGRTGQSISIQWSGHRGARHTGNSMRDVTSPTRSTMH